MRDAIFENLGGGGVSGVRLVEGEGRRTTS